MSRENPQKLGLYDKADKLGRDFAQKGVKPTLVAKAGEFNADLKTSVRSGIGSILFRRFDELALGIASDISGEQFVRKQDGTVKRVKARKSSHVILSPALPDEESQRKRSFADAQDDKKKDISDADGSRNDKQDIPSSVSTPDIIHLGPIRQSEPVRDSEQEESQEQKSWRLCMHGKSVAGSRHPGENQDSMMHAFDYGIAVVADGVSISRNPREASSVAARETFELLKELQYDMNPADAGFAIGRIIRTVNKSVIEEGDGGKTTVVAAKFFRYDRDLCVAIGNVGDSRAYLLRGNSLRQLTEDDNPPGRKNVLFQYLGYQGNINVHVISERLQEGDMLLLCSDGAYGPFDREHIASILKNPEGDDPASALVRYAQAGTDDDISAIVVEVEHIFQKQESSQSSTRPPLAVPPPIPVRNEVVEGQFREMDEAVPQPAAANDGAEVNSQNGQDQKKPKKGFWDRLGDLMDTGNGW